MSNLLSHSFGVLWRTALVRAPRPVPDSVLYYTSPSGPQPINISLPSRGNYKIPVHIFIADDITPQELRENGGLPVVLDFHGGGFFMGSNLEQAPFCAQLARELRAVVITVDYRMGPVDKFPAAIEDGEDILSAILDSTAKGSKELREAVAGKIEYIWNTAPRFTSLTPSERATPITLDTTRLAISGFSSGGNLALNLALSVKDPEREGTLWPSRIPPTYAHPVPLLLYYPSFDSRLLPSERTRPPHLPVGSSFWAGVNDLLAPSYLPRERAGHPRASPGLADIRDGGLHPQARMLLILPELDTLAEQSETWVKKVVEEGRGRDLRVERFKGMKHGWTQMPDGFLSTDLEKTTKKLVHDDAVVFVREIWAGKDLAAKA